MVVGLPAGRLCRAGRRARVQREHRDADDPPGRARGRRGVVELAIRRRAAADPPRDHRRVEVSHDDRFRAPAGQAALDVTGSIAVDAETGRRARSRSPTRRSISRNRCKVALVARGIEVTGAASTPTTCSTHRRPAARRVLARIAIAAAARHRDDDDEGQPEPVRGDAAEGGRRGEGRTGHHRRRPPATRGSCSPRGAFRPHATCRWTARGCRATTTSRRT